MPSKKHILAAIRSVAKETKGGRIRLKRFLAQTEIPAGDIFRHFASWNGAVAAAGFDYRRQREFVEADELLKDWGEVTRKLQRTPSYDAYNTHGKYSSATIYKRFGSWVNVPQAFRAFAEGREEWTDVLKLCPPPSRLRRGGHALAQFPRRMRRHSSAARPREDRPSFGDPIDNIPGLLNAPTSETGVIMVFGMLVERLGFHVRSLRPAFPDCIAMRWIGGASWQEVTIEFEFESRNFRTHRHPTGGCDILVCWVHNWEDCPASLEVIALSEELERLREAHELLPPG